MQSIIIERKNSLTFLSRFEKTKNQRSWNPFKLSSHGSKKTIELGKEERKERAGEKKERLFEDIIAKNFSNLMKNFNLHMQETPQVQVGKTQRDIHQHAL